MFSDEEDPRKRKSDREDDNDDEANFKRSKKLARTPPKFNTKMEENIEGIMKLMNKMNDKINDMSEEVKKTREEQKEFREEIKELRMENKRLKDENTKLKKNIIEVEERVDRMEREKRLNNLVIQGLKIGTNKQEILIETMENFIKNDLKVDVKIENAIKLSETTCLIKLQNQVEKHKIMQNKNKLRARQGDEIYIQEDLSVKDREIQRQIRLRANEEKRNGSIVKVGYRKIKIGNDEWRWSIEEGLLKKQNNPTASKNL